MIDTLKEFTALIYQYPLWFRYIFFGWFVFSALLLSGFFLVTPHKNTQPSVTSDLSGQIAATVKAKLSVPESLLNRYEDVISDPSAGITKLLPAGELAENMLRGGGTYWSFVRKVHEYNYGSDIKLENGQFKTGFAGADYGYFLRLGKVPIRRIIDAAEPDPPSWLDESRREAWRFLWEYRPPIAITDIRQHQTDARNKVIGGVQSQNALRRSWENHISSDR